MDHLLSNLSCIGRKAIAAEHIIGDLQRAVAAPGDNEMMEITGIGMGLVMTGVAVATGGLLLEAAVRMMGRSLRILPLTASPIELASVRLD
jgi:hypothetical protein